MSTPYHRIIDVLIELGKRERLSGKPLLERFRTAHGRAIGRRGPLDDSDDVSEFVGRLSERERQVLALPPSVPLGRVPRPETTPPRRLLTASTPVHRVRVHAVLCTDDDGSGEAASANVIDPAYLTALLAETSKSFASTGIELVPDATGPLEEVASTGLNREFDIPTGWALSRAENHKPWDDVTHGHQ